jgi:hypothetical protein
MIELTPIKIYRRDTNFTRAQFQQLQTMLGSRAQAERVYSQERYTKEMQYWVVIFNWHLVEESRQLMIDQVIDPAAGLDQGDWDLQSWIRSYIKFCDRILAYMAADDDFRPTMEDDRKRWRTILSRVKKFEKTVSESII